MDNVDYNLLHIIYFRNFRMQFSKKNYLLYIISNACIGKVGILLK